MPSHGPADAALNDPYAGFSSFYEGWAAKYTDDVDFYVARALEVEGPVLELGAGGGRVAVAVAAAGRDVIAVDLSDSMIELGRARAVAEGVSDRITWIRADMRSFVADPPVDLVVIPFRAFLHMLTTDDQLAALESVRRSLTRSGRLILNFFQPDPAIAVRHDGSRRHEGTFVDDDGLRCETFIEAQLDVCSQILSARVSCDRYDGDTLVRTDDGSFRLRFVYRAEFEHLLARTGFELDALYGWFDGRPFEGDAREMIWIARKPDG